MTATDLDLLRQFVRDHSQDAFTALVNRHVNLVYSAALRQIRSPQLAEEIAQSVFADLARNAEKLSGAGFQPVNGTNSLTPWLYAVARRTAIDVIRKESRRQLREQIAVEMNVMNADEANWSEIEPLLDDALAALDETDRTAILLRFFENKNLREVGASLNLSDDAAQKRVSRAVERLREFFSKRNVTIGASGLAVLISTNAVQSAPIGLATTISAGIFAGTAVSTAAVIAATKTIAMTTFQKTLITAALVITAGAGIFEAHQAAQLREQNQTLRQQQTTFADQLRQLQTENESLSNRLAEIGETKKLSDDQFNELLKLRGYVGVLRRQLDEFAEKNRTLQNSNIAMFASKTNAPVPQVHIKARFFTMPDDVFAASGLGSGAGILSNENAQNTFHELASRAGVEVLAEPEVVTASDRQTQMRATQIISVVTNLCLQETNGSPGLFPQTESVETGPIIGVTPRVLPDGYTIALPIIASVTDFLGYAPTNIITPAYTSYGQKIDVPTVTPQFQIQQATNSVNLLDNQTLVFALNASTIPSDTGFLEPDGSKSKYPDKKTLVFVTATLVDADGNRVHEDGNYTNIPPQ